MMRHTAENPSWCAGILRLLGVIFFLLGLLLYMVASLYCCCTGSAYASLSLGSLGCLIAGGVFLVTASVVYCVHRNQQQPIAAPLHVTAPPQLPPSGPYSVCVGHEEAVGSCETPTAPTFYSQPSPSHQFYHEPPPPYSP